VRNFSILREESEPALFIYEGRILPGAIAARVKNMGQVSANVNVRDSHNHYYGT